MSGRHAPAQINLIEEIKKRLSRGKPSPIEIAGFKKKAEALKSTDIDDAFSALGIIACIEGNVDECIKYHERSLQYARFPSILITNYANSMKIIGRLEEAIELSQRARRADMTNLVALDLAIKSCFELGDEKRYLEFASEWKKVKGKEHPSFAEFMKEINEANGVTAYCMLASEASLMKIWDNPEEDAAWQN